jgi:lipopolysaccharide transport system ATP-binding protein
MMGEISAVNNVIQVESLSKKYIIRHERNERYVALRDVLTESIKNMGKCIFTPFTKKDVQGQRKEEFWALKDISFAVKQGERIGIIGKNGAGKSTLLKILSRITEPTYGRLKLSGRVSSLLEVGTGFHPELTGRENIYLNGAILGMSRVEINKKFDDIIAFSEVEKFLDTPVKRYSSGMQVRLAFSVAAHLEPEILLVDEVLAVGDASFQKKCLGKMDYEAKKGRTILFVSHNMGAISQLCPKSIWLEEGRIKEIGESAPIISAYLNETIETTERTEAVYAEDINKEAQLLRARLLNDSHQLTRTFHCDEPVVLELLFKVRKYLPGMYGFLSISRLNGPEVLISDSMDLGENTLGNLSEGLYHIYITIPPRSLAAGEYTVYLNFTTDRYVNVDSPGKVCGFRLEDISTHRGNNRSGFFSTLLPWEVKKPGVEDS